MFYEDNVRNKDNIHVAEMSIFIKENVNFIGLSFSESIFWNEFTEPFQWLAAVKEGKVWARGKPRTFSMMTGRGKRGKGSGKEMAKKHSNSIAYRSSEARDANKFHNAVHSPPPPSHTHTHTYIGCYLDAVSLFIYLTTQLGFVSAILDALPRW